MKIFISLTIGKLNRLSICLLAGLLISLSGYSQNVGINSTGAAPNSNAGLDVDFPNKGLLIPRVALTGTANFAPLSAHVAGMLVYNTATVSDVVPGFYYNDGTKWISGFPAGNAIGNMLYWNGANWVLIPAGTPGQFLQVSGTNIPFWGAPVPASPNITTAVATAITGISASTGANITSDGGSPILTRGVCWSTLTGPTIADTKTTDGSGIGIYVSSMTGLTPVTTYYVRAYAINSTSVSYGNEISFTTLPVLPTLAATTAATSITSTTAVSGGNVTATGGAPILERGICYSTTTTPTIANTKIIDPAPGTGSFVSNLTGLTGYTTYYVRSYATTSVGTAYGTQISFRTLTMPPTLVTVAATGITGASAVSGGSMNWNGGGYSNYQNYGVAYATTPGAASPTLVATNTANGPVNPLVPIAPWTTNLNGLAANTTYYIRAYLNLYLAGTGPWVTVYGNELTFTTATPTAPVVASTNAITAKGANTATSGGVITSDGGSAITAKGVCWSTSPSPTLGVGNFTTNGTGTASFVSNVTGLTANTVYYLRAYATNAIGTSYGPADISFKTWVQAPYTLGQNTGYGWCAYVDSTGAGFIVSPDIYPTAPATTFTWGCSGTHVAVGTALGTGKANTDLIIATCGATTAAGIAKAYTGGGYTDWYLPSSGEWAAIAQNYYMYSLAINKSYFTSSEYMTNYTYASSYFSTGSQAYASGSLRVGDGLTTQIRAIRSFTAATVPVLSTDAATNIMASSATSGGNITSDGGAPITARGVCWNTVTNPTTANSTTADGTGPGAFVSSLSGLTPSTTYFVRAYATNIAGTSYGNEVTFTTAPLSAPILTTSLISAVNSTGATSGGNITGDGGSPVTARGVCWSTTPTAVLGVGNFTSDGAGTGSFVSTITGLLPGTLYYLRAYATNGVGTSYGNELSFTTINVPVLTTTAITNIAGTSATSGGNITNDGGAIVTMRGVCWDVATGPVPGIGNFTTDGTGSGTFISNITGLTTGTMYYLRAYATNSAGTSFGNELTFTPSGIALATLTTDIITNPTPSGGTSGGNITSDGGAAVTARGVCWSTMPSAVPGTGNFTSDGTGAGAFVSTITGLTPGTTYYIRAYATNSIGTAYGNEEIYTPVGAPSVQTLPISYVAPSTTGTSGVNVISDGGSPLTALGIVWGIATGPTITSNTGITSENIALGWWQSSTLTGLAQGTTYYVRAYATNAIGTTYGPEISFTPGTLGLPAVSTNPILNNVGSMAEGSANVLTDGGDPLGISSAGLCWNTTGAPTIADANTTGGFIGTFYSLMTGLTVGATYHVRAYATNSFGTGYGNEITFTSAAATLGQYISGGNLWGYVYAVSGGGSHGMIADPWGFGTADWGCTGMNAGASGTTIGTGLSNTLAIIANITANSCVSSVFIFAPQFAQGLGPDWFIPSKDEFDQLWAARSVNPDLNLNLSNAAAFTPFWSSSEADLTPGTAVWVFDGTNNTWYNTGIKSSLYNVWPVRAF